MHFNLDTLNERAYNWLLTYGPRILLAVGVLIFGLWLLKMLKKWISGTLHRKNLDDSLKPFLLSLIVTTGQVLLILGVMQILGVQMTVFAALIGGVGVAFGLALSGSLQNFTSGVLILLLKPYRVGDNIIAQNLEGTVTSVQIFYTVVNTFDNKTVIIPNSKLSNEVIINLSREGKRRMDIELKFPHSVDFETLKSVIHQSVEGGKNMLAEPAVRIGISQLERDGYKILLSVWVKAHGFIDAKLAVQEKLMKDIKATGLGFA
ncbi:MAG: mechanosensitive ion channel family protein [Bacteroidota bacterium]